MDALNLTDCDKEPIHIPGYVQPHGVLLALTEPDLTIVQVSESAETVLHVPAQSLLQQSLDTLLDEFQMETLRGYLASENLRAINPVKLQVHGKTFDGIFHRVEGLLILELEPAQTREQPGFPSFYHAIRASATALQAATSLRELVQAAADEVRQITGFDRVMVYRFDKDWNGEVIAEAKRADMHPYLDLHYPASDIPAQARELYRRNWLRLIADVDYCPSPIIPTDNPLTKSPLDLSGSVLRSVSPVHIQYLKNMGVGASMSVSILRDGQLWGLISCHHDTAKYIPYEVREACEFLGQILSLQLATKEDIEDYERRVCVKELQTRIQEHLLGQDDVVKGLADDGKLLLEMQDAGGVALCFDEQLVMIGATPDESACRAIVEWLQERGEEDIFVTESLTRELPIAASYKDMASGLLAMTVSVIQGNYVLWFRPEVLQTVTWAGDPNEVMAQKAMNNLRPRASFEAWSEQVGMTSAPWKTFEIEAARELRGVIVERVLRQIELQRAAELAHLNDKLERSNKELDSFTYVVSHDLKEPLRGIHNFASILKEDYASQLNEEGIGRLNTLIRLAGRMDDLIESLRYYSRVSQIDLSFEATDLNDVVARVLELLQVRIQESGMQIRIPRPLPTIVCDRVHVGEIYSNLLTNAMKYNDKEEKWIEIGYETAVESSKQAGTIVLYVRDNGIGIREKYFDTVFTIFKRLHGREKYGGGTGAGLTIVKRIVERHGGRIWLASTVGEGTTFYFTLQKVM
ncbi:MAG TPA: cyanobacterial phytochrome A [Ktedonobacter sp.]|nr:cyanobacterial phytochrome A [Ktedonobacter sp.]